VTTQVMDSDHYPSFTPRILFLTRKHRKQDIKKPLH